MCILAPITFSSAANQLSSTSPDIALKAEATSFKQVRKSMEPWQEQVLGHLLSVLPVLSSLIIDQGLFRIITVHFYCLLGIGVRVLDVANMAMITTYFSAYICRERCLGEEEPALLLYYPRPDDELPRFRQSGDVQSLPPSPSLPDT